MRRVAVAIAVPPGKSNRLIMSNTSRAGALRRLSLAMSIARLRILVRRLLAPDARARLHFRVVAFFALALAGLLAVLPRVLVVSRIVAHQRRPGSGHETAGWGEGGRSRAACFCARSGTNCCSSSGR